nr:Replicative DNA helicase [Candidatus Anoxychlamydiales bacterium]
CLSADTQIIDADTGKPYTLKELADRKNQKPINVLGIDSDLKIKKRKMTKVFYSGKKQVFKLTTKSGREIKASANHPFLKQKGWTNLEDLNINDKIAIPKDLEVNWDEIKSIEKLQIEDVYDATVEEVHNFVANDIIVHNSLEQDSDLVFFLLRREYYDPYDKPGQAELIVAKNRHGAVGSVNLSFRKEIARFENYTPLHTTEMEDQADTFAEYPTDN